MTHLSGVLGSCPAVVGVLDLSADRLAERTAEMDGAGEGRSTRRHTHLEPVRAQLLAVHVQRGLRAALTQWENLERNASLARHARHIRHLFHVFTSHDNTKSSGTQLIIRMLVPASDIS